MAERERSIAQINSRGEAVQHYLSVWRSKGADVNASMEVVDIIRNDFLKLPYVVKMVVKDVLGLPDREEYLWAAMSLYGKESDGVYSVLRSLEFFDLANEFSKACEGEMTEEHYMELLERHERIRGMTHRDSLVQ